MCIEIQIVGKDSHFNSLNISLDDVLKVFLSTIRAACFCNFIILFEFVLFPIPQTMHAYSMIDEI